ncbi:MAG: aromatic amino acid hydroxylase [Pseudomonadales bacterium]
MTQEQIIAKLAPHLRQFVQIQDYSAYTARDHSVWRFLMNQLSFQLTDSAHPVYLEGLRRTGISQEYIPSIDEMNTCLSGIGWSALGVDGFIPPAVFMEFQSLRILVIAMNMRTIDQLLYTPAPDILHESAGHASFLVDVDYAEFLQHFGEIGMKTLSSLEDEAVFEAIRHLSIVKENHRATEQEILRAETRLKDATDKNKSTSESALLARLHWWTVEYGLVGSLNDYKIFGAGLLSSLGESKNCLDDSVVTKKLLTPDAINNSYDITREQPQLYVTHSCRHLSQVLGDVASGMAQVRGGAQSVRTAIDCRTVATMEYNSGIQISGVVTKLITDAMDNISYVRTTGKTQLSFQGSQLTGHGIDFHSAGFGSPVGYVNEFSRCLSGYSIDELRYAGIEINNATKLEFVSGVIVDGDLISIERCNQKNILFSFKNCTVTDVNGGILFDPSWGQYDMAVGTTICSVFGGSADPSHYSLYKQPSEGSSSPSQTPWSDADKLVFNIYQNLRDLRESDKVDAASCTRLHSLIVEESIEDWLLYLEFYELAVQQNDQITKLALSQLIDLVSGDETIRKLVNQGIERINNPIARE